jgi:hypothetical protein
MDFLGVLRGVTEGAGVTCGGVGVGLTAFGKSITDNRAEDAFST